MSDSKVVKGVRWIVVTNSAYIPLQFILSIILARMSPEHIASIAIIQMLTGIITTFALYGGHSIIGNFLPKIKEISDKSRFFFLYLIGVMVLAAPVYLIFFSQSSLDFLNISTIDLNYNKNYILLFFIVLLISEVLSSVCEGIERYKSGAISRALPKIISISSIFIIFIIPPQL